MKANFALSLSFDGIRLLHRAAGGWRFVGEVALDNPNLRDGLGALRKTALELEPSGLRTKLILPDSQIKYLTIPTQNVPGELLYEAALEALDGVTPYAVSDLVFDLSPDGDQTHVAAVAIETLTEAENFATEHRFAPISIVATPGSASFLGEPFFGPTRHARTLLAAGEEVEPDGVAVVEIGALETPEGPVADLTEEPEEVQPEPEMAVAEDTENAVLTRSSVEPEEQPSKSTEPETPASQPTFSASRAIPAPAAEAPASFSGFTSRRGDNGKQLVADTDGPARRFTPVLNDIPPAPPEAAPAAHEEVAAAFVPEQDMPDDVPDPPPAALRAFLGRRGSDDGDGAVAASVAAPVSGPVNDLNERDRLTVLGARRSVLAVERPRPRFLGLILTALLLVFLAAVAAWAAVFMDEGVARFFSPREPQAPAIVETDPIEPVAPVEDAVPQQQHSDVLPQPDPEPEPDISEEVQTASLEEALPPETEAEAQAPLAETVAPEVFTPDKAIADYAVTGIWTIPPDVPSAPGLMPLNDLYVTSIDRANLSFDAIALLPGSAFETDIALRAPSSPAPSGTTFALDEQGLVEPTPDGAMTPEGVLVYLGKPPVLPPERPLREVDTPEAESGNPQPELVAFRPKARPTDLVENTERVQLGGLSRSELAEVRPQARPASLQQEEEQVDETPTAQAVANSFRPKARPLDFADAVAKAQGNRGTEDTVEVASVAPRTVTPKIPSSASVARSATVKNAISLNRINLMGVYGTPSNRRALVRLSNGRYKKVKVGDRIDGGRVSAIGDSELRYTKGSRNIVLKMPRT